MMDKLFSKGPVFMCGGGGGGSSSSSSKKSSAPTSSPRPLPRSSATSKSSYSSTGSPNTKDISEKQANRGASARGNTGDGGAAAQQRAVQKQTTEREAQNSLYQRAANFVTPNDGKSYVGGRLVGSEDNSLPDRASTAPPVRPSNLDTSVSPTVYAGLDISGDDNVARLAAANAADVAEDVRIQRIQNTARESGTTNSAYQNTMNRITPNDGKEYIGGQLVESVGASRDSLQGRGMNNAPGTLGLGQRALNYVGGVRNDDLAVGYVDGQRIYQRENGTTYTVNSFGLASNTAGPGTLDPSRANSGSSDGMAYQMGGGNDSAPATVEDIAVEEEIEPCPEGYMLDPETETCVIDPFQVPFAEAPATGAAPTPMPMPQQQLSAYTAANPMAGLPSLSPVQQANFAVPTPTMQPITMGQQGLASLPPRMG